MCCRQWVKGHFRTGGGRECVTNNGCVTSNVTFCVLQAMNVCVLSISICITCKGHICYRLWVCMLQALRVCDSMSVLQTMDACVTVRMCLCDSTHVLHAMGSSMFHM